MMNFAAVFNHIRVLQTSVQQLKDELQGLRAQQQHDQIENAKRNEETALSAQRALSVSNESRESCKSCEKYASSNTLHVSNAVAEIEVREATLMQKCTEAVERKLQKNVQSQLDAAVAPLTRKLSALERQLQLQLQLQQKGERNGESERHVERVEKEHQDSSSSSSFSSTSTPTPTSPVPAVAQSMEDGGEGREGEGEGEGEGGENEGAHTSSSRRTSKKAHKKRE